MKGRISQMKNDAKYELNGETGKYEVFYNGFSYVKLRATNGWEKIGEFESEEDAKNMCRGCLDFD